MNVQRVGIGTLEQLAPTSAHYRTCGQSAHSGDSGNGQQIETGSPVSGSRKVILWACNASELAAELATVSALP